MKRANVHDFEEIPVIDLGPLISGASKQTTAAEIGDACRRVGFFYVKNHGVDEKLVDTLLKEGTRFFELPQEKKEEIHMRNSNAYRGWFELGGELTAKKKDWKEGLYFGEEVAADDEDSNLPMHGPNQWPDRKLFPDFPKLIGDYMAALTELGHQIMGGVALSLGLNENFFRRKFTSRPFTPFRLFYYPVVPAPEEQSAPDAQGAAKRPRTEEKQKDQRTWGVGEHTDYGVLTILLQDSVGGLEVRNCRGEWVQAPPIPGTFVVNIGDMLEIWTGGLYPATPHRVIKSQRANRISAPFFFDPGFKCVISPLPSRGEDSKSVGLVNEKLSRFKLPLLYGDYITKKVEANFPAYKAQLDAGSRMDSEALKNSVLHERHSEYTY